MRATHSNIHLRAIRNWHAAADGLRSSRNPDHADYKFFNLTSSTMEMTEPTCR